MCRKHFSVLMFFGEFCEGLKIVPLNAIFQTTIFQKTLRHFQSYVQPRSQVLYPREPWERGCHTSRLNMSLETTNTGCQSNNFKYVTT